MIILHGENIVASRQALEKEILAFKERGADEIITLDGGKLELTELKQALESASLLGKDRLVVIENLLSATKSKRKEEAINYLSQEGKKTPLILWEPKEIGKLGLKKLASKAKINLFKIPPLIFKFLDSLSPQDKKNSLKLLHQCLRADSPEIVFYMICRQIRLLIIARDLGKKGLPLAPWQQAKFLSQAQKFNLDQLLKIQQRLLKIDYEQKTGRAALPLASQLDLLIADL
jgi:DNA polymerase III delta subunit